MAKVGNKCQQSGSFKSMGENPNEASSLSLSHHELSMILMQHLTVLWTSETIPTSGAQKAVSLYTTYVWRIASVRRSRVVTTDDPWSRLSF